MNFYGNGRITFLLKIILDAKSVGFFLNVGMSKDEPVTSQFEVPDG